MISFSFRQCVWDGCHELLQKTMSFIEVTIVSAKENSSRIHFWEISKDKSVRLKKKSNLNEKTKCVIMDANKMKEINSKSCIYYYWDDVIYTNDLTFRNILVSNVL